MKLETMQEFLVLGKCLNFSKAAEELYTSQSVLSRHIAALEKEMGVQLLVRNTHSVELTESGKATLESFESIIAEKERLMKRLDKIRLGHHGTVTIGVTNLATDDYFEGYLARFMDRYPECNVEIMTGHIGEVVTMFLKEEVDVALVINSKPEFPGAYYYTVGQEPFYCACAPDHPLAEKDNITWEDLQDQVLIFPPSKPSSEYKDYLEAALEDHDILPKDIIEVTNDNLLYRTIRSWKAISLVPKQMTNYPHTGITIKPFAEETFCMSIGFVFRKSNYSPASLLFLDSLLDDEDLS